MASKTGIRVDYNNVPKVTATLRANASSKTLATVKKIQATAKQLAPVLTGALRDSIVIERVNSYQYTVYPLVDYGLYQELGTINNPPHPFMQPAAAQHREEFFESMKGVLR